MDEPGAADPDEVRNQKSEADNGVGYLLTRKGHLRGLHNLLCLIVAPKLRRKQVICGRAPFSDLPQNDIWPAILGGNHPTRPTAGFTDYLWETVESCWKRDPEYRPSIDVVLKRLDEVSRT